jgi:hypothetical protein
MKPATRAPPLFAASLCRRRHSQARPRVRAVRSASRRALQEVYPRVGGGAGGRLSCGAVRRAGRQRLCLRKRPAPRAAPCPMPSAMGSPGRKAARRRHCGRRSLQSARTSSRPTTTPALTITTGEYRYLTICMAAGARPSAPTAACWCTCTPPKAATHHAPHAPAALHVTAACEACRALGSQLIADTLAPRDACSACTPWPAISPLPRAPFPLLPRAGSGMTPARAARSSHTLRPRTTTPTPSWRAPRACRSAAHWGRPALQGRECHRSERAPAPGRRSRRERVTRAFAVLRVPPWLRQPAAVCVVGAPHLSRRGAADKLQRTLLHPCFMPRALPHSLRTAGDPDLAALGRRNTHNHTHTHTHRTVCTGNCAAASKRTIQAFPKGILGTGAPTLGAITPYARQRRHQSSPGMLQQHISSPIHASQRSLIMESALQPDAARALVLSLPAQAWHAAWTTNGSPHSRCLPAQASRPWAPHAPPPSPPPRRLAAGTSQKWGQASSTASTCA